MNSVMAHEERTPDELERDTSDDGLVSEEPAAVEALDVEAVRASVVKALHRVYDPEIPVNIYELGLIYDVSVASDGVVEIKMTLTTPHCPVAGTLPAEVEMMASTVAGVTLVNVELTWDPPWTPDRMSEAARLELNFF